MSLFGIKKHPTLYCHTPKKPGIQRSFTQTWLGKILKNIEMTPLFIINRPMNMFDYFFVTIYLNITFFIISLMFQIQANLPVLINNVMNAVEKGLNYAAVLINLLSVYCFQAINYIEMQLLG